MSPRFSTNPTFLKVVRTASGAAAGWGFFGEASVSLVRSSGRADNAPMEIDITKSRQLLKKVKHVCLRDLPDGDLHIEVDAKSDQTWIIMIVATVFGAAMFAFGLYWTMHPLAEFTEGPLRGKQLLLLVLGGMSFGTGPMLFLIRLVRGRTLNTIVQVWPEKLRVESGSTEDKTKWELCADNIEGLMLDDSTLHAISHGEAKSVVVMGNRKVNAAIAELIAVKLWNGRRIRIEETARTLSVYPAYIRTKQRFYIPVEIETMDRLQEI